MKNKLFLYTLLLTVLTFSGCTQKGDSTMPNTNADSGNNTSTTAISEAQAKETALSHAGVTSDQVTFVKVEKDSDIGREKYEIEFYTTDQKEYDYEIDLYTGEILEYDYDAEGYSAPNTSANDTGTTTITSNITEAEAKQIALNEVPGATDQHIVAFKSETDDNRSIYDGTIHYNGKEYDFEIDMTTGAILEWDVENM